MYCGDNGGGIALFGDIKTMYESLPGEKVDVTVDGITFKYNRTLGTPTNYLINDDGDIIMTFVKNTLTEEYLPFRIVYNIQNRKTALR